MDNFSFSFFHKKGIPAVHLICLFLLLPVFVLGQTGGQYELSRSTIDGGGGVSTDGTYIDLSTFFVLLSRCSPDQSGRPRSLCFLG